MEKGGSKQHTLRGISERVDATLREKARKEGKSLNSAAVEALQRGLGLNDGEIIYHDLDDLAGTWVKDAEFDGAMEAMDEVDEEIWK